MNNESVKLPFIYSLLQLKTDI